MDRIAAALLILLASSCRAPSLARDAKGAAPAAPPSLDSSVVGAASSRQAFRPESGARLGGNWTTFARGPDRQSRVDARGASGEPLSVAWRFGAAGAVPLDGPPLGGDMKTMAYTVGLPVGPSLSRGLLLAGSDAGLLYALNAETGALVWSHPLWNMAMVNPLVVGDTVYATTGNPYYNFAQTLRFASGERATRGPGLNGLYALDLATGAERWHLFTPGENMPTPVISEGVVYFASGDGFAYAVDATSGKLRWKVDVQGIDGMSSPLLVGGHLFFGASHPDVFVALDTGEGALLWKRTFAAATPAGFGGATAALADGNVVVEEVVKTGDAKAPAANRLFALDPATGKSVWERELGRGPEPKGFGTATPVCVDGVIYVSSIVDERTHALSARDGAVIWSASVAGAGAGLVVGDQDVYVAAGPRLVALDRKDGHPRGTLTVGGHQGPATPLLAGETLFTTNLYGWIQASPTRAFKPLEVPVEKKSQM
jgi:outer membrane protein assembly factor BamB